MGFNHTLRPSEGGTVTRAAPCRAPLRRWEWRAVAHEQGAPRFRTRTAGWDPVGPSLATCLWLNPTEALPGDRWAETNALRHLLLRIRIAANSFEPQGPRKSQVYDLAGLHCDAG